MKKTNLTKKEKNDFIQLLILNKQWFSEKCGLKTLCKRMSKITISRCAETCILFKMNGKLCGDHAMEVFELLSDTDKFEILVSI